MCVRIFPLDVNGPPAKWQTQKYTHAHSWNLRAHTEMTEVCTNSLSDQGGRTPGTRLIAAVLVICQLYADSLSPSFSLFAFRA